MYYLIDILKLLGLDQLPGACGQLKAARGVRVMGARFSKITCKRSASREYLYRRFFVLWFCFWDGLFPCPPSVQWGADQDRCLWSHELFGWKNLLGARVHLSLAHHAPNGIEFGQDLGQETQQQSRLIILFKSI